MSRSVRGGGLRAVVAALAAAGLVVFGSTAAGADTSADLAIQVSGPSHPGMGATVVYTAVIRNLGPGTATGVTGSLSAAGSMTYVSESSTQGVCGFPGCSVGTIEPGGSETLRLTAKVVFRENDNVYASVRSAVADPDPSNNLATVYVPLGTQTYPPPPKPKTPDPCLVQVTGGPNAFLSDALPGGRAGVPYSGAVSHAGGACPWTFTLVGGTLPSGLALASDGRLTGVPGETGTFAPRIRIRDAHGATVERTLSLTIDAAPTIDTVAGGGVGDGGPAAAAPLVPSHLLATAAGVYVTDLSRIRRIAPDGTISTFAGNGTYGSAGDGGPATAAEVDDPGQLAVGPGGALYFADTWNHRVRKIAPDGTISTVAGNGQLGFSGDGGPATAAELNEPEGVAVDSAGDVFVSDTWNHRVREISASDGTISTVAGTGVNGNSGDGGPATQARLAYPSDLELDSAGNLLIETRAGLRKVAPDGTISTLRAELGALALGADGTLYAGDGSGVDTVAADGTTTRVVGTTTTGGACESGVPGPAASATLCHVAGVAVEPGGEIDLVADGKVYRVDSAGTIAHRAGTGSCCFGGDGGAATNAALQQPNDVAVDAAGNVYVADTANGRIRKVAPDGTISTFAGSGAANCPRASGDGGPAVDATLCQPSSLAIGPDGDLYFSDTGHGRICKVDANGIITTVAGGKNVDAPDIGRLATDAGAGPALAFDSAGNLYTIGADEYGDQAILEINPDGRFAEVASYTEDWRIDSLAVDPQGDVYAASSLGGVWRVDPTGDMTQLFGAGTGPGGYSVHWATHVAVDGAGDLFVSDGGDYRILELTASGSIAPVAGTGSSGLSGDGGASTAAAIGAPLGLTVAPNGDLYFADYGNARIRVVRGVGRPAARPPLTLDKPAGTVGTTVTITSGSAFHGVRWVAFGSVRTGYSVHGSTITARVPSGAITAPVTVASSDGLQSSRIFVVRPTVSSFSPSALPAVQALTVRGSALRGPAVFLYSGAAKPTVGGLAPPSFTALTSTVPVDAVSGAVTVVTRDGTLQLPKPLKVTPFLTHLWVDGGRVGDTVQIDGRTLADTTSVRFHGVADPTFTAGATWITAHVPPGATSGQITVTTPSGSFTTPWVFLVLPKIDSLSSSSGRPGDAITIHGSTFGGVNQVTFGGVRASFSRPNAQTIVAHVPHGAPSGALRVWSAAGTDQQPFTVLP